jgi:hypothetical protein
MRRYAPRFFGYAQNDKVKNALRALLVQKKTEAVASVFLNFIKFFTFLEVSLITL